MSPQGASAPTAAHIFALRGRPVMSLFPRIRTAGGITAASSAHMMSGFEDPPQSIRMDRTKRRYLLTPGYETSGTALILYALCYGVNSGILDRKTFFPAIEKAWEYLSKIAVQENFTVGYIFTTPERNCYFYDPNPKTHTNYGTGCFLLAATEYAKFLKNRK